MTRYNEAQHAESACPNGGQALRDLGWFELANHESDQGSHTMILYRTARPLRLLQTVSSWTQKVRLLLDLILYADYVGNRLDLRTIIIAFRASPSCPSLTTATLILWRRRPARSHCLRAKRQHQCLYCTEVMNRKTYQQHARQPWSRGR
jgi:hypothetical protein